MSPEENDPPPAISIVDESRALLVNLFALQARHAPTLTALTHEQQAASAQLDATLRQESEALVKRRNGLRGDIDWRLDKRKAAIVEQQVKVKRAREQWHRAELTAFGSQNTTPTPARPEVDVGDHGVEMGSLLATLTTSAATAYGLASQIEDEENRKRNRRLMLIGAAIVLLVAVAGVTATLVRQRSQRLAEQASATATAEAAVAQATATAVAAATVTAQAVAAATATAVAAPTVTAQAVAAATATAVAVPTVTAQAISGEATATAEAVAARATAEARNALEIKAGTMKGIPAGPFQMGCSPDDGSCDGDEQPLHEVTLDSYAIDTYEVTNARYATCVDAGACSPPHEASSSKRSSYYGNPEFVDYPVIKVDWNQADAFCRWEGKRLPTEAEWEKAARGSSDTRIYPWGNQIPSDTLLNFGRNEGDTTPVGAFPGGASAYGVMDMGGNVWEWVEDRYQGDYYAVSPAQNPQGPDSGDARVLRGGSWYNITRSGRASARLRYDPDLWRNFIGFRCARSQ